MKQGDKEILFGLLHLFGWIGGCGYMLGVIVNFIMEIFGK